MGLSRSILCVEDLAREDVEAVLDRAKVMGDSRRRLRPFTAGSVFLSPSLRTRAGYAVATSRLGGDSVDIVEARFNAVEMSAAESVSDTLQSIADLCDVLIVRGSFDLAAELASVHLPGTTVVNAGDARHHPTQALIDLWTVHQLVGGVAGRRIGISGDLTSRSARSFLQLIARYEPAEVAWMAPSTREPDDELLTTLTGTPVVRREPGDLAELDVLYLPGLPARSGVDDLDDVHRQPYSLGVESLRSLPRTAVVLSPLPVIDEVDPVVRDDPRMRLHATNQHATPIRMAVLEHLLTVR